MAHCLPLSVQASDCLALALLIAVWAPVAGLRVGPPTEPKDCLAPVQKWQKTGRLVSEATDPEHAESQVHERQKQTLP